MSTRAPSPLFAPERQQAACPQSGQERAQPRTGGGTTSDGTRNGAPSDPHVDDRVESRLARLAAVFRAAAGILEDISKDPRIRLAVSGNTSVMDGVTPTTDSPTAGPCLTVKDLARLLQVDEKTVRRWREDGKLPEAIEVGGVVRWHPGVVDEWLRGGGQ